jgi:hypothetical protein
VSEDAAYPIRGTAFSNWGVECQPWGVRADDDHGTRKLAMANLKAHSTMYAPANLRCGVRVGLPSLIGRMS